MHIYFLQTILFKILKIVNKIILIFLKIWYYITISVGELYVN